MVERKAPRRHDVPLFIRLGDVPIGRTRNLSRNGIFLETDSRPDVDSRHDLSLAWGSGVYSCTARVVRHADDGIGLTFEDVDTFFLQAVDEILAEENVDTPNSPASPA
jgi:PilZ domain